MVRHCQGRQPRMVVDDVERRGVLLEIDAVKGTRGVVGVMERLSDRFRVRPIEGRTDLSRGSRAGGRRRASPRDHATQAPSQSSATILRFRRRPAEELGSTGVPASRCEGRTRARGRRGGADRIRLQIPRRDARAHLVQGNVSRWSSLIPLVGGRFAMALALGPHARDVGRGAGVEYLRLFVGHLPRAASRGEPLAEPDHSPEPGWSRSLHAAASRSEWTLGGLPPSAVERYGRAAGR